MPADSGRSMDPIQEKATPGWHFFRVPAFFIRLRTAILLAGIAIVAYTVYRHVFAEAPPPGGVRELRMPVANPELEPERPDLIGEPRIDE